MEIVFELSDHLNLLVRERTLEGTEQAFNRLCIKVSEILMYKLYKGNVSGKVTFVHAAGTTVVLGETDKQVRQLQRHILHLPVVQTALSNQCVCFTADQPESLRAPGTNWSPRNCAAMMVAPVAISNSRQGAFGVYAADVGFFSGEWRDEVFPSYLRSILEVATNKLYARRRARVAPYRSAQKTKYKMKGDVEHVFKTSQSKARAARQTPR
jgi:hypothetical protein